MMKLQVTQENLSKALSAAARIADPRNSLPILANVLLKAEKNRLIVAATNLEIAIVENIGCKIEKEGSITIPARLLNDFVSSLPAGNIDMELSETRLTISSGNYKSIINGAGTEEFPAIPSIKRENPLSINAQLLKTAISQTALAASNDETRPVLTGVNFMSSEDGLIMVATDSYRLAEKILPIKGSAMSCLIPATAIQDLQRLISDADDGEMVNIYYDDSQVLFIYKEAELVSRLIEGTFPKYQQLLPEESEATFTMKKSDLITITKVASLFAKESAGSITLNVSEEDQEVRVTSVASQVGENNSSAQAHVEGEGSVTLNSRFLLDALGCIQGDSITFSFAGRLSPCILKPGAAQSDYRHVVMPLKS